MNKHLVTAKVIVWADDWKEAERIVTRMDKHHPSAVICAAKWEEILEDEEDEEEYQREA